MQAVKLKLSRELSEFTIDIVVVGDRHREAA